MQWRAWRERTNKHNNIYMGQKIEIFVILVCLKAQTIIDGTFYISRQMARRERISGFRTIKHITSLRNMFPAPFSQVKLRPQTGLSLILCWNIPICSWQAVEWQTWHHEHNHSEVYLRNYFNYNYNYNYKVYLRNCTLTSCKQYQCRLLYICSVETTDVLVFLTLQYIIV